MSDNILFRFNLFLFLGLDARTTLGQWGCLRYFSTFLILLLLFVAVRAKELEIFCLIVVLLRETEAVDMEPLIATITSDHIGRLWFLTDAIKF